MTDLNTFKCPNQEKFKSKEVSSQEGEEPCEGIQHSYYVKLIPPKHKSTQTFMP